MYPQQPGILHCSSMQSQQQKYSTPSHRRNVGAHACHCDKTNDRISGRFTPLQPGRHVFFVQNSGAHPPLNAKD